MKKILLIIAITLLIFQMVVLATIITIGGDAVNRGYTVGGNATHILKGSPANNTGKITNIDVWANLSMTGVIVAIFTEVDTNIFTVRDSQGVSDIPSGSKQSRTVDLDVVTGDYIGIYFASGGAIDYEASADGRWYLSGDQTSCVDTEFEFYSPATLSLAGQGATEEEEEANAISFGTNF